MNTQTDSKPAIAVPACFGNRHALAYRAYQMAWLKGYKMAASYMSLGLKVGDGGFPEAPPEFQGREIAVRAWICGCSDGAVQATRDRMMAVEMIADAACIMDELEEKDARESDQLQAAINADFAVAQGETRRGVMNAVVLFGLSIVLLLVVAFTAKILWF